MQIISRSFTALTALCCGLLLVIGCQDAPIVQQEDGASAVKPYPHVPMEERVSAEVPVSNLFAKTTTSSSSNLVSNGSFETNGGTNSSTFSDWTVWNQSGGSGNYYAQTGTSSPISGYTVPSPTTGTYAAMSDQGGPGSHIIYQDVAIPSWGADLSFDLFIGNRASAFYTPTSLFYNAGQNQQFRMDIMDPTAAITDLGSGVLQTVHTTPVGSTRVTGYNTITASLDAHAGETVRLRFAEVDNQLFFQAGIDNVRVVAPPIAIDIKPGSSTNPVNLGSKGKLSIALLSGSGFDATTADISTIMIGSTGVAVKNNGSYHASEEDVDNDGDTDLVLKFSVEDLVDNGDLTSTSTSLTLTGEDDDGFEFCGDDVVTIVP